MRNMAGLSKAIEITSSKRRMQVLCCLVAGQSRFNEMKKSCAEMSSTELARVLTFLIDKNIIIKMRSVRYDTIAYKLTKKGEGVANVLRALEEWGYVL
jgi:DNA-binding HxlR family transcriptional regulator